MDIHGTPVFPPLSKIPLEISRVYSLVQQRLDLINGFELGLKLGWINTFDL
jgi:hypothetical protein